MRVVRRFYYHLSLEQYSIHISPTPRKAPINKPIIIPANIKFLRKHIVTIIINRIWDNSLRGEVMKSIYIDILIAVNIFTDFFLILCTRRFLHISTSYKRMLLASIAGGILSLEALLPPMWIGVNIIVDMLGAIIIVFIAFGKCNTRSFIRRTAVYFALSFSFCGIMVFIYTTFKPKGMQIYNDIVYFNISPVLLIIMTLVCYYILRLLKKLTNNDCGGGVCNVEVIVENKTLLFCAKIDTGCSLKEPFSGFPVIIAEKSAVNYYSPKEDTLRIIPFGSLGGNGIIKGFRPDSVRIDGVSVGSEIYLALCENILKGDVKALIPPELVNSDK